MNPFYFDKIFLFDLLTVFLFSEAKQLYRRAADAVIVNPEDFSYVAKIVYYKSDELICTGSLISRSVILTAGHCLCVESDQCNPADIVKNVKAVHFLKENSTDNKIEIFYPDKDKCFATINSTKVDELLDGPSVDVGLITLTKPVAICEPSTYRKYSIIKLPVKDIHSSIWEAIDQDEDDYGTFKQCTMIGYGPHDGKNAIVPKMSILNNLTVVSTNDRLIINLPIPSHYGQSCGGDSGGPLICPDSMGQPRIFGINSKSVGGISRRDGQKIVCPGDESNYLFNVISDVRMQVDKIRSKLVEFGKMNEFIEDYKKCSNN